jgi:hypothetical protein
VGGQVPVGNEAAVLRFQAVMLPHTNADRLHTTHSECTVSVTVRDNAYDHGGPWSFALGSVRTSADLASTPATVHRVLTEGSANWYDLTATTNIRCLAPNTTALSGSDGFATVSTSVTMATLHFRFEFPHLICVSSSQMTVLHH